MTILNRRKKYFVTVSLSFVTVSTVKKIFSLVVSETMRMSQRVSIFVTLPGQQDVGLELERR